MIKIYFTAFILQFFTISIAQVPLVSPGSLLQSGEHVFFSPATGNSNENGNMGPVMLPGVSSQKTSMLFNPNPANGILRVTYSLSSNSRVSLSAYNQIGQEVISFVKETMKEGTYYIDADINRLLPGIYFIRMNAGKDIITKKLLVN